MSKQKKQSSAVIKTLVVIRHAHRDKKQGAEADNGLSKKGKDQAKLIKKHFKRTFAKTKPLILSSPKRRCLETVKPIAKEKKVKLQVSEILDEGGNLQQKIDSFLDLWSKNDSPLTVVCSHGDWIPALLEKVIGAELILDKGGWAQIEAKAQPQKSNPALRWVFQNFES